MFGTLVLLAVLLVIGEGVQGAKRWLIGPSIQPGEIAKLVTIIYVAAWLASKGKKLRNPLYGLLPFSILVGIVAGLIILQPNYSTALLIAAVAFTMFFVAGAELKQFVGSAVVAGGVATLVVTQSARAMSRFGTLNVDPAKELNDGSWQIAQTLIALASGGVFGKGLGTGGGQYGYVPLAHSDGIFAIWGEETGLLGAILLVGLFVAFAYRGFRIAQNAPDDFGRVLAAGITFWLGLQAFVNIGVVTQLIPFTGQPLPFISYGGSSLVMSMASIGILLSISRAMPKPPVVKSVPVVVGAPAKENLAATKKNATISYRGRDRRTRVSTRRRTATTRRHSNSEPEE
jgi:cell division protein FtsW